MSQLELDMENSNAGDNGENRAGNSTEENPDATGDDASFDVDQTLREINRMMDTEADFATRTGQLSNGDLAALRRISPRAPITPALWRVLHHFEIADAPYATSEQEQADYERKWAVLLMGMAHCAGMHDGSKDGVSFGRALAEAGWSEQRFVQLLETPPDRLGVQIRRVAQFLAAKNQSADWSGVYWLLFLKGEKAEKTRLGLARSYYGTLYYQEKEDDEE
jgi:CRISPR system Cascade subunit CasB